MESTIISQPNGDSLEFVCSGKADMFAVVLTKANGDLFVSKNDLNHEQLEELKTDFVAGSCPKGGKLLEQVKQDGNWIPMGVLTLFVTYCLVRSSFDLTLCILILPVYGYLMYWGLKGPKK